jgi:hypothetical protein
MTIDDVVNFDGFKLNELINKDNSFLVQVKLIAKLESEEKNMSFKMRNGFLTNKKFKDFFQKNMTA